jgi:predicted transcriptional regulator
VALNRETLVNLTADIASAHVSNNAVPVGNVAPMIESIFTALQTLGAPAADPVPKKLKGAVSVRASIKPTHLVSMIDGKSYKMLKRHLALNGYTPESYREAFGLPRDYPMVAAEYAEKRRTLAKSIGLGRKPKVAQSVKKPRAKRAVRPATRSVKAAQ